MKRVHNALVRVCSWPADHSRALIVGLAVVLVTSVASPAWGQWTCASGSCTTTGNVGIGTPSPAVPLSVVGATNINGTLSIGSNSNVNFVSDGASSYYGAAANGNFYFHLGGAYNAVLNTYGLTINNGSAGAGPGVGLAVATGNVGIGTTNPNGTLSIMGAAYNQLQIGIPSAGTPLSFFDTDGSGNAYWDVNRRTLDGAFGDATKTTGRIAILNGNSSGAITFSTTNSNGAQAPEVMRIAGSGSVGIGTPNPCGNTYAPPACKLSVAGAIQAQEVVVNTGWSDYVFKPTYRLRPLTEVAAYIQENHHLPDIPTEAEVKEKGVSLGEMQSKLLAKVEELTLHMIELQQENSQLKQSVNTLAASLAAISSDTRDERIKP